MNGGSDMAVDMFIKIGDIKGESQGDKHKDEIDVLSWSWGGTQSATGHIATGSGAGKADFHDLQITKYLDKSTPKLIGAMATGQGIPEATLTLRKVGGKEAVEYVKMIMKDCIISSIQSGSSGGADRITESISINFAEFEFDYTPQKSDGSKDAVIPYKFSIAKNKPL
jgi:type VI secretion system secreted protein Hcp